MRPIKSYNNLPQIQNDNGPPIERPGSVDSVISYEGVKTIQRPAERAIKLHKSLNLKYQIPEFIPSGSLLRHGFEGVHTTAIPVTTIPATVVPATVVPATVVPATVVPAIPVVPSDHHIDIIKNVYDNVFNPIIALRSVQTLSAALPESADRNADLPSTQHTTDSFLQYPSLFPEIIKTAYSSIVIIDLSVIKYFDYQLNRAFNDIRLIYPDARNTLYMITYTLVNEDHKCKLVITTPDKKYSYDINAQSLLFLDLVDRLLKLSGLLHAVKIITCIPSRHSKYLYKIDPETYSDAIPCYSFGHMINKCFNLCYVKRITYYKHSCDLVIERISKVLVNLIPKYNYLYHADIEKQVQAMYEKIDVKRIIRDPRFEIITHLSFNPWLMTFEILPDNGKCITIVDDQQCNNAALPDILYCSAHKCLKCEKNNNCRHVGTHHLTCK
jgi:hypothetical protein